MTYTINQNKKYNSLEVKFSEKPCKAVLAGLKQLKFRWNHTLGIWYGFCEEEKLRNVLDGKEKAKENEVEVEKCDHNFKVGDILYRSWGYEQTNLDFYKVTKVSKKCIWLVQVILKVNGYHNVTSMSRDISFLLPDSKVMEKSYDIKDQINGDRFKVLNFGYDCVKIDGILAEKYEGQELYESWYY